MKSSNPFAVMPIKDGRSSFCVPCFLIPSKAMTPKINPNKIKARTDNSRTTFGTIPLPKMNKMKTITELIRQPLAA